MRQKGIRNSIGDGLLCPNAVHDYGYADLHAKGSLIKHWQTFSGAMISAPTVIDFSVTEKAYGDTVDAIVMNYGPDSITVSSIVNYDPSFILRDIPPLPLTLNAGDTLSFKVIFQPDAYMAYTDTVRITSNDPVFPISKIILHGKGGSYFAKPDVIYASSAYDGLGLYTVDKTTGKTSFVGPYGRGYHDITTIRVKPVSKELIGFSRYDYTYSDIVKLNSEGGDAIDFNKYFTSPGLKKVAFCNDSTTYVSYDNGDLGVASLDTISYSIVPVIIGNVGFPISGMCFKPTTNELWATASNYPEMTEDRGLYKIRLTPSLDTLRVGLSGLDQVIKDIAFDSKGDLFGISGNQLVRLDTLNAQATVIGNLGVTNINSIAISPEVPVGIETYDENYPTAYKIYQNYPNPFNPVTTFSYQIPKQCHVTLKVFDILGREVSVLVDKIQDAGFKTVDFDAGNLAGGIYFYKIHAGSYIETKKLLLLK